MTYEETVAEFKKLVDNHDLTYMYSDDHRHYSAGRASWEKIRRMASSLKKEDVHSIWNGMCDRVLTAEFAPNFYWSLD
jgi:hypothetical protein